MRVKGGMSLRNGMWHDLRNGIIYAEYYTRGDCLYVRNIKKRIRISKGSYYSKILRAMSKCKVRINVNLPQLLYFVVSSA